MIQSDFVQAAVDRATKTMPAFKMIFEDGIMWQLQRASLDEAFEIAGSDPPVFVIESIAWRAEGIPRMRIGFSYVADGIKIVSFSLRESV